MYEICHTNFTSTKLINLPSCFLPNVHPSWQLVSIFHLDVDLLGRFRKPDQKQAMRSLQGMAGLPQQKIIKIASVLLYVLGGFQCPATVVS